LSVLYLLLPIAILFLIIAVAFFFWAIGHNQFDDMESPALKIVIDDHQQNKKNPTAPSTDSSNKISNGSLKDNPKDKLKDNS
jgi:cbb3-type cytochrome oxidase maturation protein